MKQKTLKYYFIKSLRWIIFHTLYKFNGRLYTILFNLYATLFGLSGRIYYKNKFFYVKNDLGLNFRFFHRKVGLLAYLDGLENRGKELQRAYCIDNIKFEDDDYIIDCGANNGDFFLCFLGIKINYIGIEPSKIEFSNLKNNIKNVKLINKVALDKSSQKVDFYISSEFGDSSVYQMKENVPSTKIDTITLDEIINNNIKKVKIIKIEAEGAEPEILYGLKKNLKKVEYITIDVGPERGFLAETTLVPCVNYLLSNKFILIDFNIDRTSLLFKNLKI